MPKDNDSTETELFAHLQAGPHKRRPNRHLSSLSQVKTPYFTDSYVTKSSSFRCVRVVLFVFEFHIRNVAQFFNVFGRNF